MVNASPWRPAVAHPTTSPTKKVAPLTASGWDSPSGIQQPTSQGGEPESSAYIYDARLIAGVMASNRVVVNKQRNKIKANGCMASLNLWIRLLFIVDLHRLAAFWRKGLAGF
jgi:hypothetical protein